MNDDQTGTLRGFLELPATTPLGKAQLRQREVALARRRELRCHPTEAAAVLWSHLRGRRLAGHKFRRQHPCGPFNLDFFCPARRLAIQLDEGQDYHPDARRRDRQRAEFLAARGISVLRFAANHVLVQTDAVLATIAFALATGRDAA